MDIAEVLQYMNPTAEFVILNNDLDTITWHTTGVVTPTLEEIKLAYAEMVANRKAEEQAKENAKSELLARLGITEEEAKLLLG